MCRTTTCRTSTSRAAATTAKFRRGSGLRGLAFALVFAACEAFAQASTPAPLSVFRFATPEEGRAVLGARDDYIAATGALERSAKLRTREAVDPARYAESLAAGVQAWPAHMPGSLHALLARYESVLAKLKQPPARLLLVLTDDSVENGLPHTRGDAIVLPEESVNPRRFAYLLAHEILHVLTRQDAKLRESLYAAIGFRPCARVEIPEAVSRQRVTNPDTPHSVHTIAVRHRGEPVEALPYLTLSPGADPSLGFRTQMRPGWLLVQRDGGTCRAKSDELGVAPESFEGLFEQIGRNTGYLFHAEEIIADNFARVFLSEAFGNVPPAPSPEVVQKVRQLMFR